MSKSGITPREQNFPDWYQDVVQKAQLAEHSPVRGCMVIKPHGFAMWENMQRSLDEMFKSTGHVNASFPLMIPKSFFSKEANHVEGFAKECAIVTHYRLKNDPDGGVMVDPDAKLEEELILRPTSETIIWDTFRGWIQSYRDLPLLVNQWCNVVRWERRTRLFLRTTEFHWQEGHTAHATYDEAEEESLKILEIYRRFAENFLAVPVLTGVKTEAEKFAGADHTYCIEAMVQDGKAIQAGTSHHLGQNFAKAFDVKFTSAEGKQDFVYATSWGVSTRLFGALIMAHSDDKGLVAPPRVAPIQVVIIPMGKDDETRAKTCEVANNLAKELRSLTWIGTCPTENQREIDEEYSVTPQRLRVKIDDRQNESPGSKFFEWEVKGVCLRIEIGPRDLESSSCMMARRDTGEKKVVALTDVVKTVQVELTQMQLDLFYKALEMRESMTKNIDTWEEFEKQFEGDGGGGLIWAHWDGTSETEAVIAEKTKATIRCIPLDPKEEAGKCVYSGKPSKFRVAFAKAY